MGAAVNRWTGHTRVQVQLSSGMRTVLVVSTVISHERGSILNHWLLDYHFKRLFRQSVNKWFKCPITTPFVRAILWWLVDPPIRKNNRLVIRKAIQCHDVFGRVITKSNFDFEIQYLISENSIATYSMSRPVWKFTKSMNRYTKFS